MEKYVFCDHHRLVFTNAEMMGVFRGFHCCPECFKLLPIISLKTVVPERITLSTNHNRLYHWAGHPCTEIVEQVLDMEHLIQRYCFIVRIDDKKGIGHVFNNRLKLLKLFKQLILCILSCFCSYSFSYIISVSTMWVNFPSP